MKCNTLLHSWNKFTLAWYILSLKSNIMSKCDNSCLISHQNETNSVSSTKWNTNRPYSFHKLHTFKLYTCCYLLSIIQQESVFTMSVAAKLISTFFNKNINFFSPVESHFATNFTIFNTTFCCKMWQIQVFYNKTQHCNLSHLINLMFMRNYNAVNSFFSWLATLWGFCRTLFSHTYKRENYNQVAVVSIRWKVTAGISAYYNALKRDSRFTLELNAAKHTNYIEKCFIQKLQRIKFPTENSLDAYLYLFSTYLRNGARGHQRFEFSILYCTEMGGKTFTLFQRSHRVIL